MRTYNKEASTGHKALETVDIRNGLHLGPSTKIVGDVRIANEDGGEALRMSVHTIHAEHITADNMICAGNMCISSTGAVILNGSTAVTVMSGEAHVHGSLSIGGELQVLAGATIRPRSCAAGPDCGVQVDGITNNPPLCDPTSHVCIAGVASAEGGWINAAVETNGPVVVKDGGSLFIDGGSVFIREHGHTFTDVKHELEQMRKAVGSTTDGYSGWEEEVQSIQHLIETADAKARAAISQVDSHIRVAKEEVTRQLARVDDHAHDTQQMAHAINTTLIRQVETLSAQVGALKLQLGPISEHSAELEKALHDASMATHNAQAIASIINVANRTLTVDKATALTDIRVGGRSVAKALAEVDALLGGGASAQHIIAQATELDRDSQELHGWIHTWNETMAQSEEAMQSCKDAETTVEPGGNLATLVGQVRSLAEALEGRADAAEARLAHTDNATQTIMGEDALLLSEMSAYREAIQNTRLPCAIQTIHAAEVQADELVIRDISFVRDVMPAVEASSKMEQRVSEAFAAAKNATIEVTKAQTHIEQVRSRVDSLETEVDRVSALVNQATTEVAHIIAVDGDVEGRLATAESQLDTLTTVIQTTQTQGGQTETKLYTDNLHVATDVTIAGESVHAAVQTCGVATDAEGLVARMRSTHATIQSNITLIEELREAINAAVAGAPSIDENDVTELRANITQMAAYQDTLKQAFDISDTGVVTIKDQAFAMNVRSIHTASLTTEGDIAAATVTATTVEAGRIVITDAEASGIPRGATTGELHISHADMAVGGHRSAFAGVAVRNERGTVVPTWQIPTTVCGEINTQGTLLYAQVRSWCLPFPASMDAHLAQRQTVPLTSSRVLTTRQWHG